MDTTNLDNLTQEQLATLAAVELRIKEITKSSALGRAVQEVMEEIQAAVAVVAAGVATG